MGVTEAFGETAAVGAERVLLALGDRGGSDLDVATEVGGVGVGLGKFAVEPDGVVSGQLGEYAEYCVRDETGVSEQSTMSIG